MHLLHAGSLSLDSLVAGLALAPLLPRALEWVAASVLFGAADGFASLVATLIGAHVVVAPGVVALYGAYVFAVVVVASMFAASGRRRSLWAVLVMVAVALSVDNLLSPTAPVPAGVASFVLALLGLTVGARIAGGLRSRMRITWIGVGLFAAVYLSLVS
jgi:putative Mn2+ efflux pump MntP